MTTPIRSTALLALLLLVTLVGAACTPSAGPLGTPATPAVTAEASGENVPTDVAPSPAAPTEAPSATPGESAGGPSTAPTTVPATTAPTATAAPVGTMTVRAYFMLGSFTDNPGLAPVLRTVPETKAVARAAMTALLAGPQGAELEASPAMYTGIPDGTRLLDVTIADGTATVDLSAEYAGAKANFQSATADAQVVYTLTQFPTVKRVRILVAGVRQGGALERSDFQLQPILPAIFMDRPAWGAAAGNPVKLGGLANVFEATFRVSVLNAKGTVLADQRVMASCGTGCWGSFKASVPYEIGKAQYGTLRVYEPSPRDGSPINVTEYRVWLTP